MVVQKYDFKTSTFVMCVFFLLPRGYSSMGHLFYSSKAFNLRTVNVHIDVVIISIYTVTGNMEERRKERTKVASFRTYFCQLLFLGIYFMVLFISHAHHHLIW